MSLEEIMESVAEFEDMTLDEVIARIPDEEFSIKLEIDRIMRL